MMITFILQPLVFHFFVTNRVKKGKSPYEIKRLVHSVLCRLPILGWVVLFCRLSEM